MSGGRPRGAATKKTREIADRAAQEGITPLELMLRIMRDETADMRDRMDMAKCAAPYIHPRLSAVPAEAPEVPADGKPGPDGPTPADLKPKSVSEMIGNVVKMRQPAD